MGVNGIYGLSGSGLDVESMVKVGMMSKQSQYDKMQQQYTTNEWKKTAYVEVYNKLNTFNTSTLSTYKMSNSMNAHTAESTNSQIKVTANASAPIMRHSVEVNAAATNAYLIGTGTITRIGQDDSGNVKTNSTKLADALFQSISQSNTKKTENGKDYYDVTVVEDSTGASSTVKSTDVAFSFSVGDGKSGGITSTNPDAVTATVADISAATSGDYKIDISQLADNAKVTGSAAELVNAAGSTKLQDLLFSDLTIDENGKVTSYTSIAGSGGNDDENADNDLNSSDTAVGFTLSDGTTDVAISVSYNQIAEGYTLQDLASAIKNAGLNITANFDSETQEFSLTNSETGLANSISIKTTYNNSDETNYAGNTTAAFLNALGLNDGTSTLTFTANTETVATGKDAQLTVNGNAVTYASNEYTQDGIKFKLNETGESTVNINTTAIEKNTINVTYGQLAEGYTFNDLTADVNALGQNTRMTYDSVNDKFSLYNKNSGAENTIAIAIGTNEAGERAAKIFNQMELTESKNGELASNAATFAAGEVTVVEGSDANVKIDGVEYTLSENKKTVNGVTYDFANATASATASATANVAINQDQDTIIANVKKFVEDYNTLLADLYKAYDEKPNKNYKPLTDSQRENMKEEQITKWEEKAKAGMLYHDQTLGKVIDEMRSAVSTTVEGVAGKYNSIFSIGISTTGLKGQLTLDEDKLKAALTEDSDAVYNVFAKIEYQNDATSAADKKIQSANNYARSGIAQRLGDIFTTQLKTIKGVSGDNLSTNDDSDLSKLMRDLQTKMSNFKSMMNAFEDKLYKKYDAMETMLAGLGVQLNYVTSAFA